MDTILQLEIMGFLNKNPTTVFTARALALQLKVSPTAIAKSLGTLEKEEMITVNKDKLTKRLAIKWKRSRKTIQLKRVENLREIYESGLADFLMESLPGATIVLFGSYSYGEDTETSDIDIAIIGTKERNLSLIKFEKALSRKISLNFFQTIRKIHENLRANVMNGITLEGHVGQKI